MALIEIEFKILGIEKKLMKYYEFASLGGDFGVISEPWINPKGHDFDTGFDKDKFTYRPYDLDCSFNSLKTRFKTIKSVYDYISNDFRFDITRVISMTDILLVTISYENGDDKHKYTIDKTGKIEDVKVIDEFDLYLKKLEEDSINETYENINLDIDVNDLVSPKERKLLLKKIYKLLKKKQKNIEQMRRDFHRTQNIEVIRDYTHKGYDIDAEISNFKIKLEHDIDLIRLNAIKRYFNDMLGNLYREVAINKTYSYGYDFKIDNKGFKSFYKSVIWLFDGDMFYNALHERKKLPYTCSGCTFNHFNDVKNIYFGMVKKFPLSAKNIDCVIDKKYNRGLFKK